MTDEETIDFQERPFTCPYCGEETMVELPIDMVEILMARADCQHCGKDFLIENDTPQRLPQ
jgi:transcription elongation factor Elf1